MLVVRFLEVGRGRRRRTYGATAAAGLAAVADGGAALGAGGVVVVDEHVG